MAVRTRSDLLAYETGIDTTELFKTSRLVSELTGMYVQPNKAIVGRNAFAHESGIHQDGVLKASITYEIMDPKSVGQSGRSLTLGKLSGRAAFRDRLSKMGYTLSDEELGRAFAAFKELADKKREIKDRDLEALVAEELRTVSETYHLDQIQVSCGDHSIPTASVRLIGPNNEVLADAALGDGPVDAVYRAINRIVGVPNELIDDQDSERRHGLHRARRVDGHRCGQRQGIHECAESSPRGNGTAGGLISVDRKDATSEKLL
jgi:2-isopropylmalate synthase